MNAREVDEKFQKQLQDVVHQMHWNDMTTKKKGQATPTFVATRGSSPITWFLNIPNQRNVRTCVSVTSESALSFVARRIPDIHAAVVYRHAVPSNNAVVDVASTIPSLREFALCVDQKGRAPPGTREYILGDRVRSVSWSCEGPLDVSSRSMAAVFRPGVKLSQSLCSPTDLAWCETARRQLGVSAQPAHLEIIHGNRNGICRELMQTAQMLPCITCFETSYVPHLESFSRVSGPVVSNVNPISMSIKFTPRVLCLDRETSESFVMTQAYRKVTPSKLEVLELYLPTSEAAAELTLLCLSHLCDAFSNPELMQVTFHSDDEWNADTKLATRFDGTISVAIGVLMRYVDRINLKRRNRNVTAILPRGTPRRAIWSILSSLGRADSKSSLERMNSHHAFVNERSLAAERRTYGTISDPYLYSYLHLLTGAIRNSEETLVATCAFKCKYGTNYHWTSDINTMLASTHAIHRKFSIKEQSKQGCIVQSEKNNGVLSLRPQ